MLENGCHCVVSKSNQNIGSFKEKEKGEAVWICILRISGCSKDRVLPSLLPIIQKMVKLNAKQLSVLESESDQLWFFTVVIFIVQWEEKTIMLTCTHTPTIVGRREYFVHS